jgi:hypothetical protein
MFFFETNNQKTFAVVLRAAGCSTRQQKHFFAALFQKAALALRRARHAPASALIPAA